MTAAKSVVFVQTGGESFERRAGPAWSARSKTTSRCSRAPVPATVW